MTLEQMIGLRLAVGFHGTEATPALIASLRTMQAQSVVVFSRNFTSPEQFVSLIRTLEDAVGIRLLVMVDHEGGRVIRFSGGVTRFPAALTIGKTGETASVEAQGRVEAEELARLRVRVNLAPCVDVLGPGADPIIGDRSYGADPAQVAALAVARLRGLQRHGVAACAKHFPGLGEVPRDPHTTLPTIGLDRAAMESVHLVPFRAAIQAGVAMVMSSHVCYPALGDPPGLPATFSSRLIREWLRGRLGFSGVTLTDDLEMGALRSFGTVADAAVRATEAGHDLLLICSELPAAEAVFRTLHNCYSNNTLNKNELEESAFRVVRVRQQFLGEALRET